MERELGSDTTRAGARLAEQVQPDLLCLLQTKVDDPLFLEALKQRDGRSTSMDRSTTALRW